jgi:hypothetical protein
VARLELQLPRTPGLTIELDGKPLEPGARPVYVLPGRHVLAASAPRREPHRVELQLAAGAQEKYEVPDLLQPLPVSPPLSASAVEPSPLPPAEPALQLPPPAPTPGEPPARVLPWALIGTGSSVVVAGMVTGLMASAKEDELAEGCPSGTCPNPRQDPGWQDKIDDTRRMALVTDVLWGVGLATLGAGITLLVLDAGAEQPAERAELQAGCGGSGCNVALRGRF